MTTTSAFYRREQQLSSVRLARNSNLSGTYSNGPNNNGVGATLTIAASSLTIDSVVCAANDRVLLFAQTNGYENGIYFVSSIGATVILERAPDFQSFEQMKPGYYVPVAAGTQLGGALFCVVEPQVNVVGTDSITFVNISATPDSVTLSNTGLQIYDTGGDHLLTIQPNENLSANRTLSLVTGDAARTITLSGNPTLADWFDQAVKVASSPTFANPIVSASITIPNSGLHVLDTNASHDLVITPGSDLTADRILTLTTGDAARTVTLNGSPTLDDWFDQSVKVAASPTFANPIVSASITVPNTGLHILDSNASHDLVIVPGSDLTADRNFTLTTGDAARTLDISAANVTISAHGAALLDDANPAASLATLGIKVGTTAAYGGGGTSNAFVATGLVATDRVVASILNATNSVAITQAVPTADTLTIRFSADPGAATTINWVAISV